MYTIKTQCSFEAAHRLYDVNTYSTECRENIHGHSFVCEIEVGRNELNDAGMCADFKLVKTVLREEVEKKYDHSCILRDTDPLVQPIRSSCKKVNVISGSPTAETLCKIFYKTLNKKLRLIDDKLILLRVSVQETKNNIATYEPKEG